MSLSWPLGLAALLAAPLLILMWWLMRRRRRRVTVRVSSVALIQAALPGRSLWRRRIPVILFVTGLLVIGTGVARPQASVIVPANATSILLAIDVSMSMCSTDIAPNRLTAAREAARQFVQGQNGGMKIGLVAFSGISGLLVEPTTDRKPLLAAIDNLKTYRGTAIGLAILSSIDAIAETNPDVASTGVKLNASPSPLAGAIGEYEPDIIVVLTDGANTQGVHPVVAAEQAAARRIRIFTIGFGTTQTSQMVCSPEQIGAGGGIPGDGRGRFTGGAGGRNQQLDEATLTKVADLTGGKYFRAQDAKQLSQVLSDLPSKVELQRQKMELSVWFVLGGMLLVMAAIGLSLWWNRWLSMPKVAVPLTEA
jgi:Ca-activated chloride channel family protein